LVTSAFPGEQIPYTHRENLKFVSESKYYVPGQNLSRPEDISEVTPEHMAEFRQEMHSRGYKIVHYSSDNSKHGHATNVLTKTVYFNRTKKIKYSTLLDEFAHVFGGAQGKGRFLPDQYRELHERLWEQVQILGNTADLGDDINMLYHQFELWNFIRSGKKIPGFMLRIPKEDIQCFLTRQTVLRIPVGRFKWK
jgi:hypothetical protein